MTARLPILAQVQDRGILEQKSLKNPDGRIGAKERVDPPVQMEWEYKNLELKIRAAEESLNQLMEQQDLVTETVLDRQRAIKEQEQAIQGLNDQIEKIRKEANEENIKPFVKIKQVVYTGTTIKGKQASLIIHTD